jgi:hypothetical protein
MYEKINLAWSDLATQINLAWSDPATQTPPRNLNEKATLVPSTTAVMD